MNHPGQLPDQIALARGVDMGYGSHGPLLAACVARTAGPVLELGSGYWSTFMLDVMCAGTRLVVTADSDKIWLEKFRDLESPTHLFYHVPDWSCFARIDETWDVALVDHAPGERRATEIDRLRGRTRFIVVHDTEEAGYRVEPILRTFKYRFTYKRVRPWADVVSDTEPFRAPGMSIYDGERR